VPGDEDRVDGHPTDGPAESAGLEHRRLAQADHRDIHCAAALDEPRLLAVADQEGVGAVFLRLDRLSDPVGSEPALGHRAQVPIWWREAMNREGDPRSGIGCQTFLQPTNVRLLFLWVHEALIPDSCEPGVAVGIQTKRIHLHPSVAGKSNPSRAIYRTSLPGA